MKYKEAVRALMRTLTIFDGVVFLGEGIMNAGRVYGTMDDVPRDRCLEMPVAENLIMGVAMGLCLEGFKPVVVFQRMDFMTVAADAIINHLALLPAMSNGQIQFPILIRAIIGEQDSKFEMGPQHCKDLTHMFDRYIKTVRLENLQALGEPLWSEPLLITEERGKYETDFDPKLI